MEEKDIYKELTAKMVKVFGWEMLAKGSMSRSEIIMMVGELVRSQGLENVTEQHLVGIRDIMDGTLEEALSQKRPI